MKTNLEKSKSQLFYEIEFGGHLKCKIKVSTNGIEVEAAVNGWGNPVPLTDIIVTKLPE